MEKNCRPLAIIPNNYKKIVKIMTTTRPTAGILSLATYIPRAYHDADYIAANSDTPADIIRTKLGWYQKNVPGPGDGTVAMGIKAARKALYYSGLAPERHRPGDLERGRGQGIPQLACGPENSERVGLHRAWSFDMQQRCGTTLVALKLARDMIRADDKLKNILVVSGYRNSDLIHYPNSRVRWMYYLAAGGAACVIQRNCPKNEILDGHCISDGSFAWDVYVPSGGSASPMTAKDLQGNRQYLDVMDPEGMKDRLERLSLSNWMLCIDRVLEKCGYQRSDVDYLATLLVKKSAHDYLVDQLGIDPEQTRYLAEFGHHGQNDQILSLELALEENRLKDGDLVLMISAGIGYAWNATALRWGKTT